MTQTTMTSYDLQDLATTMRNNIGPEGILPQTLRVLLADSADLLDDIADGKADPNLTQGVIDQVNAEFDKHSAAQLENGLRLLDEGEDEDDIEKMRAALMLLIPLASDDEIRVVLGALSLVSDADELQQIEQFIEAPAFSKAVN
jgi:hypothetical protein